MILLLAAFARGESWQPHPWPSPALGVSAERVEAPSSRGVFESMYRWYRRTSDDRADCPYYPTCSGYGILAVRERGPILGMLLTTDRLFREYPGMQHFDHYEFVTPHGSRVRLLDPVPERQK